MDYNIPADAESVETYSEIGCYPMFYVTKSNDVICPDCVNKNISSFKDEEDINYIVARDANWEDPELYCDECSEKIPSAYADDDEVVAE